MFPEKLSFRFSIVTFAILFACSNSAHGDFYDDFDKNVIKGFNAIEYGAKTSVCIKEYRSHYNQCYDAMNATSIKLKRETDYREHCCNLLEYRDCVEKISNTHCGKEASLPNYILLALYKDIFSQCKDYQTSYDCLPSEDNPVIRIGVYLICAVVGIVLIYCLYRLYKRFRN